MMFPPSIHGQISPSRLQRIIDCPGSFRLTQAYENSEQRSSYAEEGSMLHAAVEAHLVNKPFLVDLSDEQKTAVEDCIEYYEQTMRTVEGGKSYIEHQVFLKGYDSCLFECYGTCDVVIFNHLELHIIDWKFGKGVPVYAQDNDQLYAYAVGAAASFGGLDSFNQIFIHCIQPRLNSYDAISLTPDVLQSWLDSRVIPGVRRAHDKHAPFSPGPTQCRWCPAKNSCRARFNLANQTAADVFKAAENFPDDINIVEITELLKRADTVIDIISDFRTYIQREIQNGKTIPGWKLVHGRSIRQWRDNSEAQEWLANHISPDEYDRMFETTFVSPARAERRFRTVKKDPEFQDLIEKPLGKPKLAMDTDPRPAIEYQTAADKFKEAVNNE